MIEVMGEKEKKKKAKKNPKTFDLLKKVKERKDRLFETDPEVLSLKEEIFERYQFRYFSPESFKDVDGSFSSKGLRRGLWISEERLKLDDITSELLEMIGDELKFTLHRKAKGKAIDHLSWYESRYLAKELGGRMLTCAEFFAVYNRLSFFQKYPLMLADMTHIGSEWTDTIIRDKKTLYTNTRLDGFKITGGVRYDIHPVPETDIDFGYNDVNPAVGLPGYSQYGGLFRFRCPDTALTAIKKDPRKSKLLTLNAKWSPDYRDGTSGMRLVFEDDHCFRGELG